MKEYGKFLRNRYFYGKLLTSVDFITEQTYFMEKHRRHNRFLHGCGVVEGLNVSIDEGDNMLVEPGSATDCAGNLVVVDSRVQLGAPSRAGELCVVVKSRRISGPTTGRSSAPRRFVSGSAGWAWERCSSSRAVLGRMDTSSRSTGSCGTSC